MEILPINLELLSPVEGPIFKLLLGSNQSKPILMDFISAVIRQPVVSTNVIDPAFSFRIREERSNLLHVNCGIFEGPRIDIELEVMRERGEADSSVQQQKRMSIYHLCDFHSLQDLDAPELLPCYHVELCPETLFPERKGYFHTFSLRHDEDCGQLTEQEDIHAVYVELNKVEEVLKKPVSEMTDMEKWAIFLRYADDPSNRETVNRVIETKETLQKAGKLLCEISQSGIDPSRLAPEFLIDEDLPFNRIMKNAKRMANLAEADIYYRRMMAAQPDIEAGKEEGRRERSLEIARKLLKRGRPIEEVEEDTGLSVREIKALKKRRR